MRNTGDEDAAHWQNRTFSNWESCEEQLQQYFKANGVTDADKNVAVILTVIGSHLYKLLCNLVSPSKPAEKLYERVNYSVKVAFGAQANCHSRKAQVSKTNSKVR